MSTHQDGGGPAYPVAYEHSEATCEQHGMTLRDYFAAKAMHAVISTPDDFRVAGAWEVAKLAYDMADAMLKARGANQ